MRNIVLVAAILAATTGFLWALALMWQSYSIWGALAFLLIPPVALIYPFYEWLTNGVWQPATLVISGGALFFAAAVFDE